MSKLSILNTSIRTHNDLYSLNDLHKASGELTKHRPSLFIRNDQTKELIAEIESANNDLSTNSILAHKSLKGGLNAGVWACEELVLAYATWISPKFHLVVLRAFLALHKGQPQQLALPEPVSQIVCHTNIDEMIALAWLWKAAEQCREMLDMLYPGLEKIGSSYAGGARGRAKEYVRTIEVARQVIQRLTADITDRDHYNAYVLNGLRKHKIYS